MEYPPGANRVSGACMPTPRLPGRQWDPHNRSCGTPESMRVLKSARHGTGGGCPHPIFSATPARRRGQLFLRSNRAVRRKSKSADFPQLLLCQAVAPGRTRAAGCRRGLGNRPKRRSGKIVRRPLRFVPQWLGCDTPMTVIIGEVFPIDLPAELVNLSPHGCDKQPDGCGRSGGEDSHTGNRSSEKDAPMTRQQDACLPGALMPAVDLIAPTTEL